MTLPTNRTTSNTPTEHVNDHNTAHGILNTLNGTSVANTPAGNIAATDVQGAINELDSEKAAKGAFWFSVKDYGATGDGTTNDTAGVQAAIDAAKAASGTVFFPHGSYSVTNLTLDYTADTAQASSGPPYGFLAPSFIGESKRGSQIIQRAASTGVVLKCNGKLGTSAGPGNNNKISGLVVRNLTIQGVGTGSHGLQLESVVDCSVENLMIRSCGGSGLFLARNYFDSGSNDEYAYNLKFENIRAMVCSRWGFEMGYPNAVSYTAINCDAEANTLGGWLICGVDASHNGCRAIGNTGPGFKTIATNQSPTPPEDTSTSAGVLFNCCRAETNSTGGGYEFYLAGGTAPTMVGCVVFATAGAHCIGYGPDGSGVFLRRLMVLGGYYSGDSTTAGQKFMVTGTDGQNAQVNGVRVEYTTFAGGGTLPNQLVTNAAGDVSWLDNQNMILAPNGWIDFRREIVTPGAAGAGFGRLYIKDNGSGSKAQLAVRMGAGSEAVLTTEGVPLPIGQTAKQFLLNGSSATYRESILRTEITSAQAMTTGVLYIVALPLFAGDVVTDLTFFASVALTRGSTAGTAHLWAALFDTALGKLSQSTDEGDTAAFSGFKAFTLGAAQTIATSGVYYAGIMCVAGTGGSPVQPTIRAGSVQNNAISTGTGTQKPLAATDAGPYTATAPTTTTTATATSVIPYALAK